MENYIFYYGIVWVVVLAIFMVYGLIASVLNFKKITFSNLSKWKAKESKIGFILTATAAICCLVIGVFSLSLDVIIFSVRVIPAALLFVVFIYIASLNIFISFVVSKKFYVMHFLIWISYFAPVFVINNSYIFNICFYSAIHFLFFYLSYIVIQKELNNVSKS